MRTLRRKAFALALALCTLAVCACTRVGSSGKTPAGRNPWTHPDRLVIAAAYDPRNLNPVFATASPVIELSMFLFSYAVRYDDKSRPVADALREVPTVANGDVSKDGLTLRYKLRAHMVWHDGAPLTCRDFAFTWHVVMNPHNNVLGTDGYNAIRSIDCSDPLVAVVHMKRLYAPFLQTLWSLGGSAPILPEHLLAKLNDDKGSLNSAAYNSAPVGSGPYRFVHWNRGSDVELRAFDRFYLGKPKIQTVVYRIISDENTLATLMVTHEIDLLFHGTGTTWQRVRAIPGTVAIAPSIFEYTHLDFNLHRPVFADRRVRRALESALDRPTILANAQHGLGDLAETDQSPKIGIAYDPSVPFRRYDPALARRELDAAGWHLGPGGVRYRNGVPLAFTISTQAEATENVQIETLVQAYWRAVGVQASIKNAPTDVFFDNSVKTGILQGGKYDAAVFSWAAGADPDDNTLYSASAMPPHGENTLFWNDPAAGRAIADALSTVDMKRRIADYHIVQQRLASEVPTINLFFRHEPQVYNDDLKGFTATPVISTPFWNTWQYEL